MINISAVSAEDAATVADGRPFCRTTPRHSVLTAMADSLGRLRASATLASLVQSIPVEAASLGYDRAMFSWIEDEYWIPESAYCAQDRRDATALLAAGRETVVNTRELMETSVVRGRKPLLVLDARTNPRVHPAISPVSESITYAAAPVIARDHVAAIIHVDRNRRTGLTDEFDRDVLALFAQSVGVLIDMALPSVDRATDSLPSAVQANWYQVLTPREREVLRLVADGLTNAQISARLYVSDETIKTHIRKLMRKMGVENRSRAGAMYHRLSS